ncbi:alpha/beta hydrolase [Exiguobacterium undae]|uniref:alpha/beta hydrolase n=1 Tax=Exiguobacterium undae TaxID=169177 RepID=UPI00068601E6|nr:alpha/beta hydrolase [Exiguobacterium undae]
MNLLTDSTLPIRIFPAQRQDYRKIIFLYHGWGSSVTKYEEFARMLSEQGFTVIVPELHLHDTRNALGAYFDQGIVERHFWEVVFQSIEESSTLVQQLNVPREDIIWLGVSMGGFIASGAAAKHNGSAGVININGSGSFLFSEQLFRSRDKRDDLTVEEERRLQAYDPVLQKQSTPTLFVHGQRDAVIPIETQEHYVQQSVGTNNDLTFFKYPFINHTVSDQMIADTLFWLDERF